MNSIPDLFASYDVSLSLKVIFITLVMIYIFFWNKLSRFSDELVTSPFLVLMSYFIFNSFNLISLIFFIEVALNIKDILYKVDVERFESYFFKFIRYPFWLLIIYCYYMTFGSFELISTVSKSDFKLTIAFTSVLVIISCFLIGLLYRGQYRMNSKSEKLTTISILFPTIILKLVSLLSIWSDLIIPSQKIFINIFVLFICITAFILSFRYIKNINRDELIIGFVSLVLISTLPLLVYINETFWDNFSVYSMKLLSLLVITHVFYLTVNNYRFYQVLLLFLIVELIGISPFGHLGYYFGQTIVGSDFIYSISSLVVVLLALLINYRSISKSLSINLKPLK